MGNDDDIDLDELPPFDEEAWKAERAAKIAEAEARARAVAKPRTVLAEDEAEAFVAAAESEEE